MAEKSGRKVMSLRHCGTTNHHCISFPKLLKIAATLACRDMLLAKETHRSIFVSELFLDKKRKPCRLKFCNLS